MIKSQPGSIDWNDLWQQARSNRTYKTKSAAAWDRKAPSFARRNATSLYINTFLELLHQMGIRAAVEFIQQESTLSCSSEQECLDLYTWMFHDLTTAEKKRLRSYVRSITTSAGDGTFTVHRKNAPVWAYMHWEP